MGARASMGGGLADAFRRLTRGATWRLVAATPVAFDTHHPQGLAKVGDALFLSSVEVNEPTRRYGRPRPGGMDRSAGRGVGHLFKLDLGGRLLDRIALGEGDVYHPGGIDHDGRHVWVPVAEYRPNGRSIVYRVDPATMRAAEAFRYPDHIGCVACDTDGGALHGASWGARRFYAWRLPGDGSGVADADIPPDALGRPNPCHYIDYQDCRYVGGGLAICSGLGEYRPVQGGPPLALGGMDLVDLRWVRPVHQVPVELWTEDGRPMTRNPVWTEPRGNDGLRIYFIPEDRASRLFVYDVRLVR
ncbi:MAG TPA: DUF6454 family protein [Geminicoccaceae bacterium]|nr:DUF6454 family protein [Geminicoccaceae bacterium]